MGRFSDNGLKKPSGAPSAVEPVIEASPVSEPKDNDAITSDQKTNKPENQYTEAQMKPVNVGGFRVPLVVRAHWQSKAKFSGEKVATELRAFLVERYGLPAGITEEDLMC
ncbi:MAG: hypothetical protein AAFV90_24125 [Cyanobacteria bacterium J06634_5]